MSKRWWRCLLVVAALWGAGEARATDWTYCDGAGHAFADAARKVPAPGKAWICQLPLDTAGARCPSAQGRACEGGKLPGPHDVPNGGVAWFWAQALDPGKDVRCVCGCFVPSTPVLTRDGPLAIGDLLAVATRQAVTVQVRAAAGDPGRFVAGPPLRAHQFTKGPETKPLYRLRFANGGVLELTDRHPVLIVTDAGEAMVRADELRVGDLLRDATGGGVTLTAIETFALPARGPGSQDVINLASDSPDPVAHVIVAGGVQVGDNVWQRALEVRRARMEQRHDTDLAYLDEVAP